MVNREWIGVKKAKIKCPICGKPDWCGISDDRSVACCMRVESDKPTQNGGYLHRLSDPIPVYLPPRPVREVAPNLVGLFEKWEGKTEGYMVDGLAMALGVDVRVLNAIRCAWNGEAWAFPMFDDLRQMIGIRLRAMDGRKWAVTGSHQGLFIPRSYPYCIDDSTFYLTEGPTDLAAAMTLGLYAIARPSCLGQEQMIVRYLKSVKARRVVIISDCDNAGIAGARKLQKVLSIKSCIYATPAKDLREYAQQGGTALQIESAIKDVVWQRAA